MPSHVLPKGFRRIRHYGFLANRARRVKLARIGECFAHGEPVVEDSARAWVGDTEPRYPCPACDTGTLRAGALVSAPPLPRRESG